MFRYMALVWDVSDGRQSRTAETLGERLRARQWQTVLDRGGLRGFCIDAERGALEALPLANHEGVIFGSLFERSRDIEDDRASRKAALDADRSEAIVASKGRWLVDNCWGNYAAVLRDLRTARVWVLKDPTGSLPCFTTDVQGLTVVFSHIGDCLDLELGAFSINRSYLQSRVIGFHDLGQNALNEISQVRRGECVELDPAAAGARPRSVFYWNPATFTRPELAIEEPDRGASSMRATVRACTRTLAEGHESLLLRLSGGLDSSIIAGCLGRASAKQRIACYTYYNPHGRSDERPWARLVADHVGCEHSEQPIVPAAVDFASLVRTRPAAEPPSILMYILRGDVERRLAQEYGATAVFTGDGGDSGFCSDSFSYLVTAYLRRHGLRPEAFRLAAAVALRTERSTWEVLRMSLSRLLFGTRIADQLPALRMASKLVTPQLRDSFAVPEQYPHPWFSGMARVPWEIILRVGTLLTAPEFYNVRQPAQAEPEVVSPLYAQPAVELFLRIPIYRHAEGGRDRGLARRAFLREVPEPILRRLWKDRAPGFHSELLHLNRDLVRELLLDGVLVREGLLDRAAVEDALSPRATKNDVLPAEVFRHLEVEVWARQWQAVR